MKGKNIVFTVGMLAVCAGAAVAAPHMAKAPKAQRFDPSFVTPEYFVDGVWVEGPTVPYVREDGRDFPDSLIAWDSSYLADGGASDWVPGNDPCATSGPFLFTNGTDTSSANYYTVRNTCMVTDFSGMAPTAVGALVKGHLWQFHNPTAMPTLRVRIRWYDACNTANSTSFTGTGGFFAPATPTVVGQALMGITWQYTNIPAGYWYSNDNTPRFTTGAFTDTAGGLQMVMESAANIQATDCQFFIQGTASDLSHPGSTSALKWIDDTGELGRVSSSHAYDLTATGGAVALTGTPPQIQITGTAATGNESYNIADSCLGTGHGLAPAMAWWIQGCTTQETPILSSPANGATGVTNPVTCSFNQPTVLANHYDLNVKLNGHAQVTVANQLVLDIPVGTNLDDGRAYGWSITAQGGGTCAGAESEIWTFRMAGCAADYNNDLSPDFFDYLDFVDDLSNGRDRADFNADQVVDFFDYLDFVDALSAGC